MQDSGLSDFMNKYSLHSINYNSLLRPLDLNKLHLADSAGLVQHMSLSVMFCPLQPNLIYSNLPPVPTFWNEWQFIVHTLLKWV